MQYPGISTVTFFRFLLMIPSFGQVDTQDLIDFPNATYTFPHDINNKGEVVGNFIDANGQKHGFLFSENRFTKIDFRNALWTEVSGINDAGEIVGAYQDSSKGSVHGFLKTQEAFLVIDYPGARTTKAVGINNRGQIIGFYDEAKSFLLSEGTFSKVAVPGADLTIAQGINDSGEIVGLQRIGNRTSLFLFSQNNFRYPLLPSYVKESSAYGIDNHGRIIGVYIDLTGLGRGFLLSDHYFVSLYLPSTLTGIIIFGINDRGAMVGTGCEQGRCHGLILPVPILRPSTGKISARSP